MIFFRKFWILFGIKKLTLKVSILDILVTFTQVTVRLENFLVDWLLVLNLKEGLVECATVCVQSWVKKCFSPTHNLDELSNESLFSI